MFPTVTTAQLACCALDGPLESPFTTAVDALFCACAPSPDGSQTVRTLPAPSCGPSDGVDLWCDTRCLS